MIGRRHFLGLSALTGQTARETGKIEERFTASTTYDRAPRVGIVLFSFCGLIEHDGTPLKGLPAPRPVGAQGRLGATLNGETVMREEARAIASAGSGSPSGCGPARICWCSAWKRFPEGARLSVLLTGPRNDGDTVEGIRWSA